VSAGSTDARLRVHNELEELAPLFRAAVERSLAECRRQGLDAFVYEAYRTQELQAEYFSRGRTRIPPVKPVTNAPDNLSSWHGYGLAVDVISRSKHWGAGDRWFRDVAAIFKVNECKWGGDWRSVDLPHFQWHLCKASPSAEARQLITTAGVVAVWEAVGATGSGVPIVSVADEARLPELRPTEPPPTSAGTGEAPVVVVTASALNMRHDPSTRRKPKRVLVRGDRVEVLEAAGAWLRVRVGGDEGFVHGKHVASG
jgi:peptidoglycan L-alanyl-D-glutamate endopeptidase CwlK